MTAPEDRPPPLRVVVCDDSGIFREGLTLLLEVGGVSDVVESPFGPVGVTM